jgi:predicted metalloprotease with PDZ domain
MTTGRSPLPYQKSQAKRILSLPKILIPWSIVPLRLAFTIGSNLRYWGKPHQFVVWGEGNADVHKIIQDTAAVIEEEANIFGGGLPYDRYMFLLHLSASGYGGLEHKDCCSLNYPRFGFRKEKYLRFINLVAHEFFHTWNVKRLRPKELETFDYDQENYTPSLWFSEGVTSYYDQLIPLRVRIYDAKHFFKLIGDSITRLQTTPGRQVQSLRESSLDTWIKLYRPEPHSPNTQISYYLKGELVAMLLDLLIRHKFQNRRSLDDVMRSLWQKFGKSEVGFTEPELFAEIEAIAGESFNPSSIAICMAPANWIITITLNHLVWRCNPPLRKIIHPIWGLISIPLMAMVAMAMVVMLGSRLWLSLLAPIHLPMHSRS